jgi:Fungal Zn(2)-Cys(6) binuclear cluster domain
MKNVTTSCNFCRIKKIRCDGILPCFQCNKRNIICEYEKFRKKRGPLPGSKPNHRNNKFIKNINNIIEK